MTQREQIISDYIDAYNNFDVEGMAANLDESVRFENLSNGVTNMSLTGLASFKEQAEQAKSLFSKRTQSVKSFTHRDDETEVRIDYYAVLATDFPNGLKKGDEFKLQGKSIFKFAGGKVIGLTDIS
jgi:ribosomal protein S1